MRLSPGLARTSIHSFFPHMPLHALLPSTKQPRTTPSAPHAPSASDWRANTVTHLFQLVLPALTTVSMRYVRFLKTPRVVADKGTARSQVYCLVTLTSDLGDSFLPYNVQLSAELLAGRQSEQVVVWRTAQWTGGMRSLAITLPLPKSQTSSPLRVRVGVDAKSTCDEYSSLSGENYCGTVSAWSAPFSRSTEAMKLAERRFLLPTDQQVRIWEETGESIARHLW